MRLLRETPPFLLCFVYRFLSSFICCTGEGRSSEWFYSYTVNNTLVVLISVDCLKINFKDASTVCIYGCSKFYASSDCVFGHRFLYKTFISTDKKNKSFIFQNNEIKKNCRLTYSKKKT